MSAEKVSQRWGGVRWWSITAVVLMLVGTVGLFASEPNMWRLLLASLVVIVSIGYVFIMRANRTTATNEGLEARTGKRVKSVTWDNVVGVRSAGDRKVSSRVRQVSSGGLYEGLL